MTGDNSDIALIVRYVPHYKVAEYEALGWVAHPGFYGIHHGAYSCLLEWPLSNGEPIEPGQEHLNAREPAPSARRSFFSRMFGWWM